MFSGIMGILAFVGIVLAVLIRVAGSQETRAGAYRFLFVVASLPWFWDTSRRFRDALANTVVSDYRLHGTIDLSSVVWNTIIVYLVLMGGLLLVAFLCEGCKNPFARFTGEGSSRALWLGNARRALMIAIGMNLCASLTLPGLWWDPVVAVILPIAFFVYMVLRHRADGANYGNEMTDNVSSNSTPTKLYHDFMIRGVGSYLSCTTWVLGAIVGITQLATAVPYYIALVAVLAIGLIIERIFGGDEINRAKLFPANWWKDNASSNAEPEPSAPSTFTGSGSGSFRDGDAINPIK